MIDDRAERLWARQSGIDGVSQIEEEEVVRGRRGIDIDNHRNRTAGFTGRDGDASVCGDVIRAGHGCAVRSNESDLDRDTAGLRKADAKDDLCSPGNRLCYRRVVDAQSD